MSIQEFYEWLAFIEICNEDTRRAAKKPGALGESDIIRRSKELKRR